MRGLVASRWSNGKRARRSTQVNRAYSTTHGGASPAKHGAVAISGRVTRGATTESEIALVGGARPGTTLPRRAPDLGAAVP